MNVKKNKKGFTLMEMLIVVAVIAVLVAIAIPVLSNNLHKARVAADWANLRSYYAYLQADLIQTGELVDEIDGIPFTDPDYGSRPHTKIVYPGGNEIALKTGAYYVRIDYAYANGKETDTPVGYQIYYYCGNAGHDMCVLVLGAKNS